MAGHSQFKNIMYRKGAQDRRRAKVFTRLIRELSVAAKQGTDPDSNPALRAAMTAARAANMPKDNIERVLKRVAGSGGDADFETIRYEGYGPGGVAMIVDALTDNRNRTASEVRAAFSKHGGSLGESNSVAFMFDRVGQITYPAATCDEEVMFEAALEAGAGNVESTDDGHEVTCDWEAFHQVRDRLEAALGAPDQAGLIWKPRTTVPVEEDKAATLFKLLEALDDSDDVQSVAANFEISDQVMARLTA